jgi:hypothetical protein
MSTYFKKDAWDLGTRVTGLSDSVDVSWETETT